MKEIKFANIRKEYMSDSIKETVFLILLGISTIFFLSPATEIVVSMSILTSIAAIWLTYWISKYILK
jgi:protein-S-isoprenylcysteine O-methyltransferase Ste14